jgi:hypothetical protein
VTGVAPAFGAEAGVCVDRADAVAPDDDQERKGGLLLLGKRAVKAHRLARALAAESDEREQSRSGAADR